MKAGIDSDEALRLVVKLMEEVAALDAEESQVLREDLGASETETIEGVVVEGEIFEDGTGLTIKVQEPADGLAVLQVPTDAGKAVKGFAKR